MKKYVFGGIVILVIILIYNLLSLYTGIFINLKFNPNKINYFVTTDNENIYLNNENYSGEFIIKGVELNSCYPGYNFSDYSIDKKTYLKWIEQIGEMGANTIKLLNRMDSDFYDALYEYNSKTKNPIYILQGINITDYDSNNSKSIYNFKEKLINECKITVDVIHGNRYLVTSEVYASGLYNSDVSKWTLCYIISSIGKDETLAYTNNNDIRHLDEYYSGRYFYTNSNYNETEYILADIFDKLVSYEVDKYGEQRLVSFVVNMMQDTFNYKENINSQVVKMSDINFNRIKSKDTLKTGMIVSYDFTTQLDNFFELLTEEEYEKYAYIIKDVDTNSYYDGFVDFINRFYETPLLISNYGFSTSRNVDKVDAEPITESEQGEKIVEAYKKFVNVGACGVVISTWQDNWALETWNTTYSADKSNEIYWLDSQSVNQKYGILSFSSENEEFVDGDISNWTEENFIIEENGMKLYAKYDYENLYILIKNIYSDDELYIPIDTTQNSGAKFYDYSGEIKFDRFVDFVIKINGNQSGEILVHEYYDAVRANYESDVTGVWQYDNVPDKNVSKFVKVRTLLKKNVDPNIDISKMNAVQRKKYKMYKIYNTGELIHGNSNPESEEFNSLADYHLDEDFIEIKIPWALLNFYAPNKMLIHDDYYKNYGVESIKINEMYLGVGKSKDNINLGKLELTPWKKEVLAKERLKQSYYIIKECWNEE